MASLLEETCRNRLEQGGRLLIPFLTAGYPNDARFDAAVRAVAKAGADILEIGVPFSDPLADGPTIQRASQRALEQGTTLAKILARLEAEGRSAGMPIVLMTYLNPIHRMGIDSFCRRARSVGVDGVLVSDLPPDESPEIGAIFRRHGLDRIILLAPTTRPERIDLLVAHASGFLYCITRTGVTGMGAGFSSDLSVQVERIRRRSSLPIVAGFGIRTVDDVRRLRGLVDGVVIGARLLEILDSAASINEIDGRVSAFLSPIRQVCNP